MFGGTRKLATFLTGYTIVWLVVYIPGETLATLAMGGPAGLLHANYIVDLVGMGLMTWGVVSARARRASAPGVLAAGWSWTAAVFWRGTTDRFWWASLGRPLYFGPIELWLGPMLTGLAILGMIISLMLLHRERPAQTVR